jgi:hypothetical protein
MTRHIKIQGGNQHLFCYKSVYKQKYFKMVEQNRCDFHFRQLWSVCWD